MNTNRAIKIPTGIIISAILMILFGMAEVVTAFTHKFFILSVSTLVIFTISGALIGLFYVASGILILTMKKPAVILAIVLLCLDIIGRIALTVTGLYPTNTAIQTIGIIIGTGIAAVFAIYIRLKWHVFQ